jgi:hypothetical protein
MVSDGHKVARLKPPVDAAGGIGQQQGANTEGRQRADGKGDAVQIQSFIIMGPPAQDQNRGAGEMAKTNFSGVTADGGPGETGDFGKGYFPVQTQFGERMMKTAAEHDGQGGPESGNRFQAGGGGFRVGQSHGL